MKFIVKILTIALFAVSVIGLIFAFVNLCIDIDSILSNSVLLQENLATSEMYSSITWFILFYSIIVLLLIIGIAISIWAMIVAIKDTLGKL